MRRRFDGPFPGGPPDYEHRLQLVIDFWNGLRCCGDAGETTWGVLEELEAQVSDSLSRDPIDLDRAECLTAYAACLMSGQLLL